MRKKIYMAVTRDEYELPVGVYDSLDEMAEKQQVPKTTIKSYISKYEHGDRNFFIPFRRVIVEE